MAKRCKIGDLVMVEWEDSRQPCSAWQRLSGLDEPDIVKCLSTGWLVYNGKDVKMVAPNKGDAGSDDEQVSGVIQIPARCIIKISKLSL